LLIDEPVQAHIYWTIISPRASYYQVGLQTRMIFIAVMKPFFAGYEVMQRIDYRPGYESLVFFT
jgi:hypothetical protein